MKIFLRKFYKQLYDLLQNQIKNTILTENHVYYILIFSGGCHQIQGGKFWLEVKIIFKKKI